MDDDSVLQTAPGSTFRVSHDRTFVARFKFPGDPLFLVCCGGYALNRWLIKPHTHVAFFQDYFNDLLLIPCALPLALWVQRRLGLCNDDAPPSGAEVCFHLAVWSVVCEWLGPKLLTTGTGDPYDVLAYAAGALAGWVWWNRGRFAAKAR